MEAKREVKLHETLDRLIREAGFTGNRKKIADRLKISEARLSQYLRNGNKPSFGNLLAIAEYFNVSLDYLVYGDETVKPHPIDYEPIYLHTEQALAELSLKRDAQVWAVGRIVQVLVDQVEGAANSVLANAAGEASNGLSLHPGMLLYKDITTIEMCSSEVLVLSTTLQHDVKIAPDGTLLPGNFLRIVAKNLGRTCRYRYLLPILPPDKQQPYWEKLASVYKQLLVDHFGISAHDLTKCEFKTTDAPVFNGCVLYRVDKEALQRLDPVLSEQISYAIDREHWLGLTVSPSDDPHADTLMDSFHLHNARLHFRRMWKEGQPL